MLRLGGRLSWAVLWLLLATLVLTGTVRAAIQGNSWFPIGPAPGTGLSKDHPGSWSGRATVVAMNPAQSFDLWIGTAGGGVWHSTDGAATWKPTSDDEKSLAIGALALADCDGNGCLHVYAGTGENAIRRDTTYGRGLLVGTVSNFNSTVTWQLRTGCTYPFTPCYNFTGGSINNVLLDPRTSGERRVIYITLSSGVTASASESTVTAPEPSPGGYGIYKSSDNGLTWAKLAIPGSEGFRPSDLKMDPTNPDTLYAGFLERGIFRTTNKGATWCPLNPGIPKPQGQGCPQTSGLPAPTLPPSFDHIQMVIDPDDSQHLYATFGRCPDRLLDDCTPSVVETFDGGLQWNLNYPGSKAPTEDLDCPATYSRYMHGLTLWPNHPETLFLSGFHLCKSTDHGTTWSPSDYDTVGFNYHTGLRHTHPDHHMVIFDQTGALAYEVSDGGIATSTDGGTFWTPRNLTLQTTEFQSLAVSPQTPRVIGGTQDNDGLMWLGGKQWEGLSCCGDGGFSVMDKLDKGKMYLTSNATDLLENFSVIPERSWNGGKNFDPASYLIPWNEPRSFYPPLIQDTFHFPAPLYFGTQALYKSTDNALGWSQVSPYLSTDPEPEIHWGEDAITAIAVAPSDPNRIYLGYYSGKVFATDVGGCDPFTDPSCWYETDFLLPRAPITSLAVDPTDKDVVYATLSGFFPGSHVYYHSSLAFAWFPTGSLAELNGVPANWITVEPGARNILWLGTDKGVYKSNAFGKSWFRFSQGLPNVPVYQIAIDQDRQRVFAATHGRGAYMITGPLLSNYEGCVNGYVWSAPVYGNGFDPGHFPCDLRLLRQDGTVCAASPVDAAGGTAWSDVSGNLVTSKNGYWSASPTVWACLNGKCVGGVSVNSCNPPNNPLTTVVAICGPSIGIAHLSGCPNLFNPPSSWFSLTGTSGGFFASGTEANLNACAEPSARTPPGMSRESPLTGGGTFQLLPAVQSGDGTSRRLCSVNVPYSGTDTGSMVLQNASDAVNLDPTCQSAGVSAEFRPAAVEAEPEDQFPHPGNLVLHGAAVAGQQLVPSLRVGPGQADGLCFDFAKLGVPVEGQVGALRVQFATAPAGAQGGSLSLTETSSLGDCSITVPTAAGDSAMRIAGAFETAFQASGLAGPNPGCPSEANPHDMQLKGEALVSAMASSLEICLNDPGVGVSSAPAEICFTDADCEDGNPCTHNSCDPTTGRCQAAPEPDGIPCDDGDACTLGNACASGTCGTPLSCNDGNACTTDTCDPATGGCTSIPVQCDDANPCTSDFCNADTGRCLFSPMVGTACDDGSRCTTGDTCVLDPASGKTSCQGTAACQDGDACTADVCDPATGGCLNPPIQCDDGNPCTVDSCEGGVCNSSPMTGTPCDDGNLCTSGDACVPDAAGAPVCQGQAMLCNDDNVCTMDQCDPATGGCVNPRVPLGDVPGLQFGSGTMLAWPAVPGANSYNTYRGTIPMHLLGSRPPPQPIYDQTCFEMGDANGDGPLVSIDPAVPPPGTAFYYLVTQVTGCGEGPAGRDSDGTVIPNSFPCPTGP